jgi:hypothetical protein
MESGGNASYDEILQSSASGDGMSTLDALDLVMTNI